MAVPTVVTKTLIAANAAVIAASQTPVSGTPLALVGGSPVTLDSERRVLLTYGNEAGARTMVLTGTNSQGATISETLAIPAGAGGTVASVRDYLTITSALPLGGGWTAAATLGTNNVGSTMWQIVNYHAPTFQIGFEVELTSGAGKPS